MPSKPAQSLPSFLQAQQGGLCLAVRLQPRAKRDEIGEAIGNELRVKVTAPPVDYAANEALLYLLAKQLDCPRRCVRLLRGQTSRHKIVFLEGLSAADIVARLIP